MKWLVLHSNGTKETFSMDKRQLTIAFHLDVPIRDMRLMDSVLKTTTATGASTVQGGNNHLLVRDNALVMSMEHVRCIITADLVGWGARGARGTRGGGAERGGGGPHMLGGS